MGTKVARKLVSRIADRSLALQVLIPVKWGIGSLSAKTKFDADLDCAYSHSSRISAILLQSKFGIGNRSGRLPI